MKALVTGASSGIGRDMARILSEKGYDLIVGARRRDRLENLQKELKTGVQIISADLSDEKSCFDLYEQTCGEKPDILINAAGFGLFGAFAETDLQRELQMISVNIRALHILTKLFYRDFVKRDSGYILNVASSAALPIFFPVTMLPRLMYFDSQKRLPKNFGVPAVMFISVHCARGRSRRNSIRWLMYGSASKAFPACL